MNCRYSIYCREPVTRFYIYCNYYRDSGDKYFDVYYVCETHKLTNYGKSDAEERNEISAEEFEVWKVMQS